MSFTQSVGLPLDDELHSKHTLGPVVNKVVKKRVETILTHSSVYFIYYIAVSWKNWLWTCENWTRADISMPRHLHTSAIFSVLQQRHHGIS